MSECFVKLPVECNACGSIPSGLITTGPMEIYVSTTGNDDNGDGSETAPYKTMRKALSTVPKLLAHIVNIHVAAGTYDDAFLVDGFVGLRQSGVFDVDAFYENKGAAAGNNDNDCGCLNITGNISNPSACRFNGQIRVHGCECNVTVAGILCTYPGGAFAANSARSVCFISCIADRLSVATPGEPSSAFSARNGAHVTAKDCIARNKWDHGYHSLRNSSVVLYSCTATNTVYYGATASQGGTMQMNDALTTSGIPNKYGAYSDGLLVKPSGSQLGS